MQALIIVEDVSKILKTIYKKPFFVFLLEYLKKQKFKKNPKTELPIHILIQMDINVQVSSGIIVIVKNSNTPLASLNKSFKLKGNNTRVQLYY